MMKNIYLKWIVPVLGIVFIEYFITSPERVERFYAKALYPYLSKGARYLLGPFPFSVGDVIYLILIVWMALGLFRFFQRLRKDDRKWLSMRDGILGTIRIGCWIWIVFQILWGMNYYRTGIPEQFGLKRKKPEKEELDRFASILLKQVISHAPARARDREMVMNTARTTNAYRQLAKKYPSLQYTPAAFKSSLWGELGNYMGYSGYFNPISGEAQVNTHMPDFVQPFTGLHEVAHQLGYAKESEANFIGFLAAYHSGDSSFVYSASLEMFLFATGALHHVDSTRSKALKNALPMTAKQDLDTYKTFYRKYQGPIDELTTWFYSHFLRWNNQPEGMYSYNRSMVYVLRYILDNPPK